MPEYHAESVRFREFQIYIIQDHSYALPASPTGLKTRFCEALARVESLEHELRNVKDWERRAKKTARDLLEDLKGKNLINEDLKERLSFYSDLPVVLLQGHEYTKEQREFALTLHLHGPKAYNYLRKSLHLGLPHPHTLQRYLSVMGFIINIDTLMLLIPELLQFQRYVCTYRFSQDHLELLFNSI
ncbi:DNA transposase THAP9 [Pangasianodon hypophthalmus]|uniref:DNA transposase THAP9 n=1 Tax=Pangasianodon hypophthalmus TaxID=310915 RepID=UPI0023076C56|nr:DNA transposase THAP9 [Pangasianodon hypophthalmus]